MTAAEAGAMPEIRAAMQVRALRDAGLLAADMTFRQLAVLHLATAAPERLRTVKAVAEAMGITRPAVSRAADALQADGLLTRRVNRHDRREIFLEATPRGRERSQQIVAALPPPACAEPVHLAEAA